MVLRRTILKASTWKLRKFSDTLVPLYDDKKKTYSVYTDEAEEIEVPEILFKKLFVQTEVEDKKQTVSENPVEDAIRNMGQEDQEKLMSSLGMDIDKVYDEVREQTKQQLKQSQMWDVLKDQVKAVLRTGGSPDALNQVTRMIMPPTLTGKEKEMFATLVAENIEEARREEGM